MNTLPTIDAVILAAGKGKRFGCKKQFVDFMGRAVWLWVYESAVSLFDNVIVVGIDVAGGKTRQESSLIGIRQSNADYVVIFDAARPLVSEKQIIAVKKAVLKHPSVSFGMEPTDTIYDGEKYARKGLIALQVPQAFDRDMLLRAHLKTKIKNATDDTIIFKDVHGIKPKILEGGKNLHKLTVKEDLDILRAL